MNRQLQLGENLAAFSSQLAQAGAAAGRSASDVTTILVTKFFPASDVEVLQSLGHTDFGENRVQEARDKAAQCPAATWHFIGQLQRNKANAVARFADYVHSIDRVELVTALDRGAQLAERRLGCFVQVNVAPDLVGTIGSRGGVAPADLFPVLAAVAEAQQLNLLGLMTVADPADPAAGFERLAKMSDTVRAEYPQANKISAGMSADWRTAITYGATHIRIGRAVLGDRADVRYSQT